VKISRQVCLLCPWARKFVTKIVQNAKKEKNLILLKNFKKSPSAGGFPPPPPPPAPLNLQYWLPEVP